MELVMLVVGGNGDVGIGGSLEEGEERLFDERFFWERFLGEFSLLFFDVGDIGFLLLGLGLLEVFFSWVFLGDLLVGIICVICCYWCDCEVMEGVFD